MNEKLTPEEMEAYLKTLGVKENRLHLKSDVYLEFYGGTASLVVDEGDDYYASNYDIDLRFDMTKQSVLDILRVFGVNQPTGA